MSDMISQMLVVGFNGIKSTDKWVEQIASDIEKNRIGGVFLTNKNIKNPKQLKELTKFLSNIKSKQPIWIGMRQVGGEVDGLVKTKGFIGFSSPQKISREKTLLESYNIYKNMAKELKENGININFAPSVNLDNKKENYSTMEEIVIAYSKEFLNAHSENAILTTINSFPGESGSSWKYNELKPYYDFIKYDKVKAIMISNKIYTQIDDENPAFMSQVVVERFLRDKLKFKGVIFSDDLQKKEINSEYKLKETVLKSINAGVNVLIFSSYFSKDSNVPKRVRKIVLDAVENGNIDKSLIENSYKRVIKLKKEIK